MRPPPPPPPLIFLHQVRVFNWMDGCCSRKKRTGGKSTRLLERFSFYYMVFIRRNGGWQAKVLFHYEGKKICIQFDMRRVGHCVHKALVLFFFTQLSSNVCFLSTDSNSILKQRKVRSSRWFPLRNAYPSFPLEWLRGQNKVYICPTIGTDVDRNSRHKLWTKVFFKTQPCMPLLIEQKNNNHICCCWSLVSTQYHEELKSNLNSENTHGVMVPNNS